MNHVGQVVGAETMKVVKYPFHPLGVSPHFVFDNDDVSTLYDLEGKELSKAMFSHFTVLAGHLYQHVYPDKWYCLESSGGATVPITEPPEGLSWMDDGLRSRTLVPQELVTATKLLQPFVGKSGAIHQVSWPHVKAYTDVSEYYKGHFYSIYTLFSDGCKVTVLPAKVRPITADLICYKKQLYRRHRPARVAPVPFDTIRYEAAIADVGEHLQKMDWTMISEESPTHKLPDDLEERRKLDSQLWAEFEPVPGVQSRLVHGGYEIIRTTTSLVVRQSGAPTQTFNVMAEPLFVHDKQLYAVQKNKLYIIPL